MAKKRRTVSLDPEVEAYLASNGVNASQLVNSLVKNYQTAGGEQMKMLDLRIDLLKTEVEDLEGRLKTKREQLDELRQQRSAKENEREDVIERAAEVISPGNYDPDNPGVRNWADKAGLPPEAFLDRLADHATEADDG